MNINNTEDLVYEFTINYILKVFKKKEINKDFKDVLTP